MTIARPMVRGIARPMARPLLKGVGAPPGFTFLLDRNNERIRDRNNDYVFVRVAA